MELQKLGIDQSEGYLYLAWPIATLGLVEKENSAKDGHQIRDTPLIIRSRWDQTQPKSGSFPTFLQKMTVVAAVDQMIQLMLFTFIQLD